MIVAQGTVCFNYDIGGGTGAAIAGGGEGVKGMIIDIEKEITIREHTLEHFGYTESDVRQEGLWVGLWKVEDGILDKLRKLPDVLDEKQKVRIVFDYDPNFPRAVIRVTGVKGGSGPAGNG